MSANPLLDYFNNNENRMMHKWMHYFEIYHQHFSVYCGKSPVVLEFGVSHGGSLQMWKNYFGPGARIYGVDINPQCKQLEEEGIQIFIGDQEDENFLRRIADEIGPVQILIDDGGHTMKQQIKTFETLYSLVTLPGVYLVEDTHTSYWTQFGGGIRKSRTFMEYSKKLIDHLNAWHIYSRKNGFNLSPKIEANDFTKSTYSMTFYDSVVVFEKRKMEKPEVRKTGNRSF